MLAWGMIAVLAASAFTGGAWATLLAAIYTTVPLLMFAQWRGWPFYPNATFRLLVIRPFWYTQLLLPLVAGGGLIGMLVGLPFGQALLAGRIAAASVLLVVVAILLLGYVGSKRLVVRHVDVDVPNLPPSFEGLRIAQLSDLHIGPHT